MKKISFFIIFLVFILGLTACNTEVDMDLESPTNVVISEGVVSWDEVDQADSYIVFIDTTEVAVQTTSYNLNDQNLAVGSYSITVVAVKDDKLSLPSTVLTFTVGDASAYYTIPTNVAINDGVLTWNTVVGATSYMVYVGTQSFMVTATTLDLNDKSIAIGSYSVYVTATDGADVSSNSTSVTYVVEVNLEQDAITLSVIQKIDETYTLDLEETDFEYADDYYDYLNALDMAEAFSSSAIMMGMTQTRAVSLINEASDMFDDMGSASANGMMNMMMDLDIFAEYDMDSTDLANMLYEFVHVMLNSRIRDIELSAIRREERMAMYETQIAAIQNDPDFIAVYDYIKTFAEPSEYDALDMLFTGESYDLIYVIMELSNGWTINPENFEYLGTEMVGYVQDLVSIADSMNDNTAGSIFLDNLYQQEDNFFTLEMYQNQLNNYEEYDDSNQEEIAIYEDWIDVFSDNKDDMIESLTVVIDFAYTVKNTIPEDTLNLIDDAMSSEEITITEMFTIKDELVLVIQDALPEAADFETIYSTMFIIGGGMADYDMPDYMDYAEELGQISNMSLDLMLALVSDIDETLFDDGQLILEDAQDEYGYMDFEDNPEVAIDFALFVINYLETFMTDNQLKTDVMKALVTDELIEEAYVMALDLFIEQIENDEYINPDQALMMTDLLEELKLNFDTYKTVVDLFGDKTSDVLTYVIDSEARIIKTIMNLDFYEKEDMSPLFSNIALLIEDIYMIDDIIFDGITTVEIESVLEAAKIPLTLTFGAFLNVADFEEDVDFDTLYATLTPTLASILLNVISLQSDFMVEADTLDFVAIANNQNLSSNNLGTFIAIIEALDQTLTQANTTLIMSTIDIVFDDIVGNTTIMESSEMTAAEVDQNQIDAKDSAQSMIDEIHALALLDANALTVAEEELIIDFMDMMGFYFEFEKDFITILKESPVLILDELTDLNVDSETLFGFTAAETNTYVIRPIGDISNFDIQIWMFDSIGETSGYSYDLSGMIFDLNDGESAYFEIYTYNYYGEQISIDIIVEVYVEFNLMTELSNAQVLNLDQVTELIYNRKLVFFSFTPTETDEYIITSMSESDPYVVVYDNYGHFINFDDGHDSDLFDFNLLLPLMAGETYYFAVGDVTYEKGLAIDILLEVVE